MVWDYQVPTIVMLTRCVESARVSLPHTIYYATLFSIVCSLLMFSFPNNIPIPTPLKVGIRSAFLLHQL